MDIRPLAAWGALATLLAAFALPVAQAPFVGRVTVFGVPSVAGLGMWYIGIAVLAAAVAALRWYRLLAIPGALVLATTLWYIQQFNALKHELMKPVENTIFSGVAANVLSTVRLEFGVAVLLFAGGALVVTALLPAPARAFRPGDAAPRA